MGLLSRLRSALRRQGTRPARASAPPPTSLWPNALACTLLLAGCGKPDLPAPFKTGTLDFPGAAETSGIAPSRRAENLFWTHNDSSGLPVLFAVDARGRLRGSVRLNKTKNIDWEDIASFELDGRAWLLVADIGDNKGTRTQAVLHVIAEPDPADLSPASELRADPAWSTPVAYPDGAHDAEGAAVDPSEQRVYLLTKRTEPPAIYSVPLRPPADGPMPTAMLVARLTGIPRPDSGQRTLPTPTGRYRAQPTALDFAPDGTAAAVLTYGDVLLYPRRHGESWAATLARAPRLLTPHDLPQAEALCFSRDSRILRVTGEGKSPALLQYKLPPAPTR